MSLAMLSYINILLVTFSAYMVAPNRSDQCGAQHILLHDPHCIEQFTSHQPVGQNRRPHNSSSGLRALYPLLKSFWVFLVGLLVPV